MPHIMINVLNTNTMKLNKVLLNTATILTAQEMTEMEGVGGVTLAQLSDKWIDDSRSIFINATLKQLHAAIAVANDKDWTAPVDVDEIAAEWAKRRK